MLTIFQVSLDMGGGLHKSFYFIPKVKILPWLAHNHIVAHQKNVPLFQTHINWGHPLESNEYGPLTIIPVCKITLTLLRGEVSLVNAKKYLPGFINKEKIPGRNYRQWIIYWLNQLKTLALKQRNSLKDKLAQYLFMRECFHKKILNM